MTIEIQSIGYMYNTDHLSFLGKWSFLYGGRLGDRGCWGDEHGLFAG